MNWVNQLGNFWPVVPYFVAPVLVSRFLVRALWIEILQAYGIWIALLGLLGFMHGGPNGEGYGWGLIMALFTTIFAIPMFVLLLKLRTFIRRRY